MNGLLIFDHLNDVVYTKINQKFEKHLECFAENLGLITDEEHARDMKICNNVIVQIFSPIVTSHRIMSCQFGNSYTSMSLQDDLNIQFIEYMGYLFLGVSNDDLQFSKKFLNICVAIVRYICGPDVYQLAANEQKSILATKLIESWSEMVKSDQAVLIEAVEQLVINTDLGSATLKALKHSVEVLTPNIECSKLHALILVQNKFLSLYSSQNAKELSSTDILFCALLSHINPLTDEVLTNISSYQVLLHGPEPLPKCLPHVVHIIPISKGVNLIFLLQLGNPSVAASLYEAFSHLHTMQMIQIQREKETLQLAFENLDLATRRLNDSLKKNKVMAIETSHKLLMKKWDVIKKKYQEFLKNGSDEALLRAETLALGFLENLKELLKLTTVDETVLNASGKYVLEVAQGVKKDLDSYHEFFRVKSIKNFSLGSDSLTVTKYLEEFPGLVHFLYVDRNTHRVTTPTLEETCEKSKFIKKKVWFMVDFARKHLQEGHTSLMWKDTAFHYTYFLWFEDNTGVPLKPATFPTSNVPLPGIISEDYYRKLKEICFPKILPAKIRCYELFCVHLGLVTASCVLEQSRRLAATVWELKGLSSQAIEFL